MLVDVRTDPVGATPLQGMVTPGYMSTQIDIVKSERVAKKVVDHCCRPTRSPCCGCARRRRRRPSPRLWIAHQIASELEVKPARESNVINIAWTGRYADEAARVANAFAQAYMDTNLELKTTPARKYADWFDETGQGGARQAGDRAAEVVRITRRRPASCPATSAAITRPPA